ncbi:MAG: stage III sporulation protein AB [Tissierellaceae bacterium]|nr:stage III sporulation protein AB [Tissierellaceae bacterium]
MATIKIIFNSSILIFSSLLGYAFGNIYSQRAKNLLDLQYCIRVLDSEIINGNLPLPDALENVSIKGRGQIAKLFKDIKDDLIIKKREDVYYSFLIKKDVLGRKYAFKTDDIEVFLYLGKVLGKTNKKDQKKNMEFIITQLDNLYIEAKSEETKNTKLYRTLGFLVGLGIVIILI